MDDHSFGGRIDRHFHLNEDWTIEQLFDELGAVDASDRRFALFLEGIVSGETVPDEEVQRQLVEAIDRRCGWSSSPRCSLRRSDGPGEDRKWESPTMDSTAIVLRPVDDNYRRHEYIDGPSHDPGLADVSGWGGRRRSELLRLYRSAVVELLLRQLPNPFQ